MMGHPLDRLVCEVGDYRKPDPLSNRVCIAYDAGRQRVADPPRFNLFRNFNYFEVVVGEIVEATAPHIAISDSAANKKAGLAVKYTVYCERGREGYLVETVARRFDPSAERCLGVIVDELIHQTVRRVEQEKSGTRLPFLAQFDLWKGELEKRVALDLMQVGLSAVVSASIVQRHGEQDIEIEQENIRIRLRGLPDPATVTVSTRLAVDRDRWQDFVLSEADERTLRKNIKVWTDQFFVSQVGLRDAYEGQGDVERQLRATLDEHLKEFGRTTASLNLAILFPFADPPQQLTFDHSVSCHIKEQTQQVKVIHKVLIKLEDIAKWVAEGKKDPGVYLRSRLEDVTQDALFDKTYLELILAFNRRSRNGNGADGTLSGIETRIKHKMAEYAQGIGYDIKQLLSLPDAEPNLLQRDGVDISIEPRPTDPSSGRFRLKDPNVVGAIRARIFGRLGNLEAIEKYLTPPGQLKATIEKAVQRKIERILLATPAHEFFTRFEGEDSVKDKLIAAISRPLLNEFAFDEGSLDIIISMEETPLSRRYRELVRRPHQAKAEVLVRGGQYGDVMRTYAVDFVVAGIDDDTWHVFQERQFDTAESEITSIVDAVGMELKRLLGAITAERTGVADISSDVAQSRLADRLARKILKVYGLIIEVISITLTDDKDANTRREKAERLREWANERLDEIKKEISALRKRRMDLALEDASGPEVADLDKRIEMLERQIAPAEPDVEEIKRIRKHDRDRQTLEVPHKRTLIEQLDAMEDVAPPAADQRTLGDDASRDAGGPAKERRGV